jgi:hypothetical protein
MNASDTAELLKSVALIIMASTGGVFLVLVVWKGRTFAGKYKQLEVSLNPQRLEEFSNKMDEVVKSVNGKQEHEPTLFATVKLHTLQLNVMQQQLSQVNGKLDYLVTDLRQQVGLRVTTPESTKEENHEEPHS